MHSPQWIVLGGLFVLLALVGVLQIVSAIRDYKSGGGQGSRLKGNLGEVILYGLAGCFFGCCSFYVSQSQLEPRLLMTLFTSVIALKWLVMSGLAFALLRKRSRDGSA